MNARELELNGTAVYGINQFSDWTPEEFRGGWLFPIFWKRADSISRLYSSKLAHAAELIMHGFHSIKWVLLIPPVWGMLVYHKVISPSISLGFSDNLLSLVCTCTCIFGERFCVNNKRTQHSDQVRSHTWSINPESNYTDY